MKSETYPLPLPPDLLKEVRKAAKITGLSLAETMRQSMKLGIPKLEERLGSGRLKPFTKEECRQCWGTPDPEFDALAAHCASLPVPLPEEDL
jgi:hypothetical protein